MTIPVSESELNALQQLVGDRYRPLSLLGKKSGRKTLLAEDSETNAKVVIKLLTFGEDFNWDDLKLFEREAETLRSLDHPAIPKYLDYFDVETPRSKGFALVQTYLEARSLDEQVKAGRRFSEEELEQIAQQLLEILEYLHSRQPAVIHRDIKPSNILLTDRTAHSVGQVFLVDFGSVQTLAAREGGTITVVGTYGYMPPEQFGGRAVPASDLYSLGATLIYLTSGRHPADLPQDELRLEFEEFVQLSPKMVGWLQTLTQPSLGKRYKSVELATYPDCLEQNSLVLESKLGNQVLIESRLDKYIAKKIGDNLLIKAPEKMIQVLYVRDNKSRFTSKLIRGGCLLILLLITVPLWKDWIQWTVLGWLDLSLILCFGLGIIAFFLMRRFRNPKYSTILFDKDRIVLNVFKKPEMIFDASTVWRIENIRNGNLRVSIENWTIVCAGSYQERYGLAQIFSQRLGVKFTDLDI